MLRKTWRLHLLWLALAVAWCQKPNATGDLRIKSDQPGAAVILDGKEVGETPLSVPGLDAGKHLVQLRKDGYLEYSQEVDFKPAKTGAIFAVLVKTASAPAPVPFVPMTFNAIHYHSSGRCFGQLVVERDVIEYNSSDGKDSFQIPVRSLTMVARDAGNTISAWAIALVGAEAVAGATAVSPVTKDPQTGRVTVHTMPRAMPGAAPAVEGAPIDPSALLPVRLETNGRKYSFMVVELRESGASPSGEPRREVSVGGTNQLFTIANQRYREDLETRPKK
jgi:hypothetical protein